MASTLYTIGHSTRKLPELADLLAEHGIKLLVDVRTIPKSGTNPQFNMDMLVEQLPAEYHVQYLWLGKELGGLRKRNKASDLNAGWDNASFRGYADYMQTQEFEEGVQQLAQAAQVHGPTAIMCAEAMYFSCHRSLIADALLVRGWQVAHITAPGRSPTPHKLTKFAAVEGLNITYPAYDHEPAAGRASSKRSRTGSGEHPQVGTAAKKQRAKRREPDKPAAIPAPAAAAAEAARTTAKRHNSTDGAAATAAPECDGGGDSAHPGSRQSHVDAMLTRARAKLEQQQQQLHPAAQ